MWFGVVSLFPEMFSSIRDYGVVGRAIRSNAVGLDCWNPRDFALDRHKTVDDRPYGGGPGMLMKVEPLRAAIAQAKACAKDRVDAHGAAGLRTIYLSPQGAKLDQEKAAELATYSQIILVSGRYEGVDERLIQAEIDEELSIGDFVLSGGELPTMVLIDAITRLLPGVLGHKESAIEDSFVNGLLDCPHYTRPELIDGQKVPDVLLSGDHQAIARWRMKQSIGRTWQRRPDLIEKLKLTDTQQALLAEYLEELNY